VKPVKAGNKLISSNEMMPLVYCATVAYGIIVGPKMLVEFGREASPLLSALGLGLAVGVIILSVKMAQRFPHLTAFQWIIRLLGPLGYVPAVTLLLYLLALQSVHAYNFAVLLQMLFLDRTPLPVIIVGGMAAAFYGVHLGIEALSRFFRIIVYLEYLVLVPLLLLGPSSFTWTHFMPFYPLDTRTWLLGPLVALGSYLGYAHAPLGLLPYVRDHERALRPSLVGLALAGLIITGATTVTLGVFGPETVRLTAYPTFEYSQVLRMPQPLMFLSRYSLFFGIVWVVAIMKLAMLDMFISAIGVQQIVGVRNFKVALAGVTLVVAVGAMLIPNPRVGEQLVVNVALLGVALSLGLLPLLGLLVVLLRRRADKVAQST